MVERRSEQQLDKQRESVTAALFALTDTCSYADCASIVSAALKPGKQLSMTATFLSENDNALTSGPSAAPPGVALLVEAAKAAGFVGLMLPKCATCNMEKKLAYTVPGGGKICAACFLRTNAKVCSVCNKTKPVCTTSATGVVCSECHRASQAQQETCIVCAKRRSVAVRTPAGPKCHACYTRPTFPCDSCGIDSAIHSTTGGRSLCKSCYVQPARQCSMCAKVGRIVQRATTQAPFDICEKCYKPPLVECVKCHKQRRCNQRTLEGPLCLECATRPVHICATCGKQRPAKQVTAHGPICAPCYEKQRPR